MTSRELIAALLDGADAGTGLYENIWPDTLAAWTQEGYPADADPIEYFGIDLGRVGAAFDPSPRPGYRRVIEDTPEWEITEDGSGAVTRRFKNRSVTPGHISWDMDGPEAWEKRYRPLLMDTSDARIPADALRARLERQRKAGRWTCFNMSFVWENFRQAVGDVCMYESLITDPAWIRDYNDVTLELYRRHILRAIELCGKPDGAWFSEDLAYNQGLFCSPRTLRELYLPWYAQLVDFLHGLGMKVILHSCGNIGAALPIIAEAGFDALHPLQVHAGCDPLAIAREYRDRFTFIGGLDSHVIETNEPGTIERAQRALINGMRDAGARYIFSSDHSISTNVRFDTYRRIVDTYRTLAERS